ncbi:MAG: methyltransferase [Bradyrhizobium sp.]|nr:methyltransferase [Bradyrhizobium sp.]
MSLQGAMRAASLAASPHQDVLAGLLAARKTLPSKFLYDAEGSRLFEAICELPEYYVTRTEITLLKRIAHELAARIPEGAVLVEFGSGASTKTRLLLDAAPQIGRYVPIDISLDALMSATHSIRAQYPDLLVSPLVEDFTQALQLPQAAQHSPTVGFFPGSTIGNFPPDEAVAFLRNALTLLGPRSRLIVGADLVKSPDELIPAYDDAAGVTAAFNKNLLARCNRELKADFDLEAFDHRALWNSEHGRMEMHLVSRQRQAVQVGPYWVTFAEGETIHTENSYKHDPDAFADLVRRAGWDVEDAYLHEAPTFGVFVLAARSGSARPGVRVASQGD